MQVPSLVRFRCIFPSVLRFVFLACALGSPLARAEPDPIEHGTFSLYFENDAFAGTDRYYTSGVQLGWSSPDVQNQEDVGAPFLPLFNLIPFNPEENYQKNLLLTIGQSIFTPDNTDAFAAVPGDRPYAGWLYGGFGIAWKTAQIRHTFMLNLGIVGSWAMAEETQEYFHKFNSGQPNGWDNQLRNELGIVATYERTWRWPRVERRAGLGWELLPNAGVAVGNVLTAANMGAEFRFGLNLPDDFGTGGISPGTGTSTPVEGIHQATRSGSFDFGIYLFARVEGRAVAHNIFLDGNTFANSVSVDKEPFVADISVGLAMNFKNTKIAYAFVYRTEEFKTQVEPQVFGTISINWAF